MSSRSHVSGAPGGEFSLSADLVTKRKAQPDGVLTEYVMQPYEIEDIRMIFAEIGRPEPESIAVMAAPHQAAQKINACTGPTASPRAHDLIDPQLLDRADPLDLAEVAEAGARLFAYRRQQAWPPAIVAHDPWSAVYEAAAAEPRPRSVAR